MGSTERPAIAWLVNNVVDQNFVEANSEGSQGSLQHLENNCIEACKMSDATSLCNLKGSFGKENYSNLYIFRSGSTSDDDQEDREVTDL